MVIFLIGFEASRSTSFFPHFLLSSPFSLPPSSSVYGCTFSGDIAQMSLPVGMQTVNVEYCEGLTGMAEGLG